MLSKLGEIRRDDGCLDFSGGINDANKDDKIIVYPCHGMKGNQQWTYAEVTAHEICSIETISLFMRYQHIVSFDQVK
jgi:hypothetical protein